MIKKIPNSLTTDIRLPATFISFLFSLLCAHFLGIINPDGILYIGIAEQMSQGHWQVASKLYSWNFYPLTIMLCSKITGTGLDTSAHILTACFSAILTYGFLSILALFTENKRILFWGALIILLHPEIIEIKTKLIRDHGFWAFYMLGLFYFLRFYNNPSWKNSFLWSLAIIVAILFRIEGLVLILGLPLILFAKKGCNIKKKFLIFFKANMLNIAGGCSLALYFYFTKGLAYVKVPYLKFSSIFKLITQQLTTGLSAKIDILTQSVLSPFADEFALPIVLFIPFIIVIGKLITGLTPLYTILLITNSSRIKKLPQENSIVLIWAGLLLFSVYISFTFARFFLQGRYVMPLCLLILLLIPFIFESFFVQWQKQAPGFSFKKVMLAFIVVLITINFGEGVFSFKGSKQYIRKAGIWLKHNTEPQDTIFSNNGKILYYSGQTFTRKMKKRFAIEGKWLNKPPKFDYYAIWLNRRKDLKYENVITRFGKPVKEFSNNKNGYVLIYHGALPRQNNPSGSK